MRRMIVKVAAVLALAVLAVPLGATGHGEMAKPLGPPPCCVD